MIRRLRRCAVTAGAMAILVAGCAIETAGAPTGDVTLFATFDDAANLTPGHDVQASNVVVGSVRGIELDGYRARVRMSIVDDFSVPSGTEAVIRRTSLLGEHYVDLVLPETFDPVSGPFLASGADIVVASTEPDVEQLAEQAAIIVGSLTADDLGATVTAAATALNGRGPVLNQLVRDAAAVLDALADQEVAIGATVDSLATLGHTLAPEAGALARTLGEVAEATATIADSRDRIVGAADALVELATATNEVILEPHAERLVTMLAQLRPLLDTLADRSDVLVDLIVDLDRFTTLFPEAIHNGSVLLLTWVYITGESISLAGSSAVAPGDPLDALASLVGAGS